MKLRKRNIEKTRKLVTIEVVERAVFRGIGFICDGNKREYKKEKRIGYIVEIMKRTKTKERKDEKG